MGMRGSFACAVAVGALMVAAPSEAKKKDDTPQDVGPAPDFEAARAATEAAIKSTMFDPDSAQFQWDYGFTGGYWKPVLQGKKWGWWTCGRVNGRNRLGGYVGFQAFAVVMRNGQIVHYQVGDGSKYDFTEIQCANALKQGLLVRRVDGAPAKPAPVAERPVVLGFRYTVVPDGAYVSEVVPESPAAKAGLTPGMVISRLNAIPVKGFSQEALDAVFGAVQQEATLSIIGRGDVKISAAR